MKFALCILVALVLHIFGGWPFSIGGGMVAGWFFRDGAWWKGAVAVGIDWFLLISYNLVVAYGPVAEMHRVAAGVAGGVPTWTIPVLTVLVGASLGLCGGLLGSSIFRLVKGSVKDKAQA